MHGNNVVHQAESKPVMRTQNMCLNMHLGLKMN